MILNSVCLHSTSDQAGSSYQGGERKLVSEKEKEVREVREVRERSELLCAQYSQGLKRKSGGLEPQLSAEDVCHMRPRNDSRLTVFDAGTSRWDTEMKAPPADPPAENYDQDDSDDSIEQLIAWNILRPRTRQVQFMCSATHIIRALARARNNANYSSRDTCCCFLIRYAPIRVERLTGKMQHHLKSVFPTRSRLSSRTR